MPRFCLLRVDDYNGLDCPALYYRYEGGSCHFKPLAFDRFSLAKLSYL